MNWTQIEGKWDQFKGKARSQWAKLTDDDLSNLQGKREQLLGKIVERYGVAKEDADRKSLESQWNHLITGSRQYSTWL